MWRIQRERQASPRRVGTARPSLDKAWWAMPTLRGLRESNHQKPHMSRPSNRSSDLPTRSMLLRARDEDIVFGFMDRAAHWSMSVYDS